MRTNREYQLQHFPYLVGFDERDPILSWNMISVLGGEHYDDALHGDALRGDALHGDALHGDALHGDALHGDALLGMNALAGMFGVPAGDTAAFVVLLLCAYVFSIRSIGFSNLHNLFISKITSASSRLLASSFSHSG
jgi:hypothetical protein